MSSKTTSTYLFNSHRTRTGTWYIVPRTYAPLKILARLTIRISLHEPSTPEEQQRIADNARKGIPDPNAEDKQPSFIYEGPLNRHMATDPETMASGLYLMLKDNQVKPLMRERSLFEYSVEIKIEAKEEN